ncbi:MAG: succinylglutamate-semialdehyde dehydrogenase [Chlamydiia bacterium]|nr:succinylglutamate-semialdehyde dehydrogenase [Chlamydiia bacterium]
MTRPIPALKHPERSLFIGGEWITGYGPLLKSKDPYSGLIVYDKASANASDVARAVRAAELASKSWALRSLEERIKVLHAYAALLKECKEDLSRLISLETGKPQWEADGEVEAMAAKISISIDAYRERCPEKTVEMQGFQATLRHRPHGVMAVLGPFNFPGHLPNGHIVPALLAGNAVVFKASELAPSVGEAMALLWEEAGLPPGVLNLLQGDGRIGKTLAEHPDIDGLAFTGSYATGSKLMEHFAKTPHKILALEMGGNNPLLFSSASDLEQAAKIALDSAFQTAGQRCTCARRLILVRTPEAETFLGKLIAHAKAIPLGPYDKNPYMGPLISEAAVVRAELMQGQLRARGAKALLELKALRPGTGQVSCGILDVTDVENIPDEEIFAPLLQVIWADDFEKAVKIAGSTAYGLSAGILTTSRREYDFFFQNIKAGVINWNRPTTGALSTQPFGGVGKSGNFRPAAYYAADFTAYPVASQEANPS